MPGAPDLRGLHDGGLRPHAAEEAELTFRLAEGELAPVVAALEIGSKIKLSVPIGAYTTQQGKPCFVHAIDVVGLAAVTLGIGVGGLAVVKMSPIFRALADRIRRG
jgi:hypothetical protein